MSKKKSHGIQLLIRAVVTDPDGKVLSDTGEKPSKSYVIQFLEFIYALMQTASASLYRATDVAGAEEIIYISSTVGNVAYASLNHFRLDAAINNAYYGIVVGTGNTAVGNTNYKLVTQLTEGIGAGNITHGVMIIGTTAVVGANVDLELKRAFTNNTGSTITVKEAGIYVYWGYNTGGATTQSHHCIIRDVLASTIDVPDKCSLTVYYTYRTTV